MNPTKFVRVRDAPTLYQLQQTDLLKVCIYPSEDTWGEFNYDPAFLSPIEQAIEHNQTVSVVGPTGTGKTFHLLLLGYKWEKESRRSATFFGKPERLAFYAKASTLDIEATLRQWDEHENDECLWLVDDMQDDNVNICRILAKEFHELGFQKHKLVFAGWALPQNIWGAKKVLVHLTPQTIMNALSAQQLQPPPQNVLEDLANAAVGLKHILWNAKYNPQRLKNPAALEIDSAKDRVQNLDPTTIELLMQLARLKFLAVRFEIGGNRTLWTELQKLAGRGMAVEEASTWQIPDDETARALLRYHHSQTAVIYQGDPVPHFLAPLKELAQKFLEQGSAAFLLQLFIALRRRSRQDLYTWLGLQSDDSGSLLRDLLEDAVFLDNLSHIFRASNLDIFDIARILYVARQQSEWAKKTAKDVIDKQLQELQSRIGGGELQAWRAGETLARLSGDTQLNNVLAETLRSRQLLDTLAAMESRERWLTLYQIRLFSESASQAVMRALSPTFAHELASARPHAIWRKLEKLVGFSRDLSIEILNNLDPSSVSEAILKAPHRARTFLACFNPNCDLEQRRKILTKFRELLGEKAITEEHIKAWTSPYNIISLINLALELQLPQLVEGEVLKEAAVSLVDTDRAALLEQLCRPVAKYTTSPLSLRLALAKKLEETITAKKEPLNERIYRLASLDRSRAKPLVQQVLNKLLNDVQEIPPDPKRIFGLLWNACSIVPQEEQEPLRALAQQVIKQRNSMFVSPDNVFTTLALSGLCAFITGDTPPEISLISALQKGLPSIQPGSPRVTVCQLYALTKRAGNIQSAERQYLEWLVRALTNPPPKFHKRWHNSLPSSRRLALRILFSGLTTLDERTGTRQLVKDLVQSIASEGQDDIWDDSFALRLEAIWRFGNRDLACQLLKRRAERWAKKRIRYLPEPVLVQFLQRVRDLEGSCPDAKAQILQLVKAGKERQGLSTQTSQDLERIEFPLTEQASDTETHTSC